MVACKNGELLINNVKYMTIDGSMVFRTNQIEIGVLRIYPGMKQCNICHNRAYYEHVFESNYYDVDVPRFCKQCINVALKYSEQCVKILALKKIYELFILFKQTIIYKNLITDVSHAIFYLSLL